MTLDFHYRGEVKVVMKDYIKIMINKVLRENPNRRIVRVIPIFVSSPDVRVGRTDGPEVTEKGQTRNGEEFRRN